MTTTDGPHQERSETTVLPPPDYSATVTPAVDPRSPLPLAETAPAGAAPASSGVVRTSSATRFAPDALVAGVVGLAYLIVGLIVAIRAGFDGAMSQPVVEMLGFTHTLTLGLIEVGIGLFLLMAAGFRSRGAAMFGGLVLGVAGIIGVVQVTSFEESLALERAWAWIALFAGVVVVLTALLMPRYARRTTIIDQR